MGGGWEFVCIRCVFLTFHCFFHFSCAFLSQESATDSRRQHAAIFQNVNAVTNWRPSFGDSVLTASCELRIVMAKGEVRESVATTQPLLGARITTRDEALALGPEQSHRIIAVLEEAAEKLGFLGSIMPDVLQHRDELSKFVGDEISRIIQVGESHQQHGYLVRYVQARHIGRSVSNKTVSCWRTIRNSSDRLDSP